MAISIEKPVALIHAYAHDTQGLSPLDKLNILAASELMKRDLISRLVVLCGPLIDGRPPLAELAAAQIKSNLPGIDPEMITIRTTARSTIGEVTAFAELAKELNLKPDRLVQIGLLPHLRRIQRTKKDVFGEEAQQVRVVSAERLLNMFDPQKYNPMIRTVRTLPLYKGMEKIEPIKNMVQALPLIGKRAIRFYETSGNKGTVQDALLKLLGRN